MANEGGEWIMHGMDWGDPRCIHSWRELVRWVNEIGFVPLFKNRLEGFSVEEHTSDLFWWTGDPEQDPWEWRELVARSGEVAYGKFFGKKAGFISKEWFPHFANFRRDGYDFDSRWDEGLANQRSKRVMDQFAENKERYSFEIKRLAGFGKDGEKNFEGTVTELQMQTYLIIRDFRRRVNRGGEEYGWPVSVYSTPEALWGYDHVTSAYSIAPAESGQLLRAALQKNFPQATDRELTMALG
jgi:hypothetical protein